MLVHFPVALFTVYALLEIASLTRLGKQAYWFYVKAVVVLFGSVASCAAATAGLLIKPLFSGEPTIERLVTTHETFAITTVVVFALIAFGYAVAWIRKDMPAIRLPGFVNGVSVFLQRTVVRMVLAGIGLACVTITGAIGGAIAYSPTVDPAVSLIYRIFIR